MNLTYNANVLCAAERVVGKTMIAICTELESDDGVSLSTLRALVAAGRAGAQYGDGILVHLDEFAAGRLIDQHGNGACVEAVGKALKAYIERSAA